MAKDADIELDRLVPNSDELPGVPTGINDPPPLPTEAPPPPGATGGPGWRQRLAGMIPGAAAGLAANAISPALGAVLPAISTVNDASTSPTQPAGDQAPPAPPNVEPPAAGDPSKKVTRYAVGQPPQGHYVPGGFAPTVSGANRTAYDTAAGAELGARADVGKGRSAVEEAKAGAQSNTAEFLDKQARETMKRAEDGKQSYRDALAELAQQQQQAAKLGIDPNHLERNMSGGQRLMYGIAAALSGAAAGFNRQSGNLAIEEHDKAIDRDIAAQREGINAKRLGVADMKDRIAILSKVADDQERIAEHAEAQRAAAQANRGGAAVTGAGAGLPTSEANLENAERGQEQALTRGLKLERPVAGGMVGGPTKEQIEIHKAVMEDAIKKGVPVDEARALAGRAAGYGGGRADLAVPRPPPKNGAITPGAIAAAADASRITAPGTSVVDNSLNPVLRHIPGSESNLAVFAQQADDAKFAAALKPIMGGRSIQQIQQFLSDSGMSTGGRNLTPEQRKQVAANRTALVQSIASGKSTGATEPTLDTTIDTGEQP